MRYLVYHGERFLWQGQEIPDSILEVGGEFYTTADNRRYRVSKVETLLSDDNKVDVIISSQPIN